MEAAGFNGDVIMRVQNKTELSGAEAEKMQILIDALEDLDDVQEVYSSTVLNFD